MVLDDLPSGSSVYVDANIFVYHFTGASEAARAFLRRCQARDLNAYTGAIVLLEVTHRLMMAEANLRGLIPSGNPAARLANKPELVKQLFEYQIQAMKIQEMGITVLGLPRDYLVRSHEFRQRYGLLTNDSLILLDMRDRDILHLASADRIFDRVDALKRYAPADLQDAATPPRD